MTDKASDQETYGEEEFQRRFDAILRAALNTSPRPLKEKQRQRPPSKRDGKAATNPSAA
jgi:hypothetical protein